MSQVMVMLVSVLIYACTVYYISSLLISAVFITEKPLRTTRCVVEAYSCFMVSVDISSLVKLLIFMSIS